MLLPSFAEAIKRLIKRLFCHIPSKPQVVVYSKEYDMFVEYLESILFWNIDHYVDQYNKYIAINNVEVVMIERNIYRFIGNVSPVYLEIVPELNALSDVHVSMRALLRKTIEEELLTFFAVLSLV